MNTETAPSRLHPLVAVAAVAVTVLSLTGIAAMLGYLPMGKSAAPAETVAAVPPAPTLAPPQAVNEPVPTEKKAEKPAARPAPKPLAKAPQSAAPSAAPTMPATSTLPPPVAAPAPCPNCGVIDNIREVTQAGEGSGLGAVAGGVLGGILGNQIGGGTGKKIATVAGVAGGAYAGHQVEKNQKKTTHYEITVRMRDGSLRSLTQDSPPAWRIGDRVRIEGGGLVGDN
ncbi:MAG: glycine zipper 2TM domain-containing protein [Rhodocyclaceae bacterium]|nr:glycine zipper 2TM domain-containing protein [Rhodocyclaceae bacterium]